MTLLLILTAVLAAPLEVDVQTTDGKTVRGGLIKLADDGVTIQSAAGEATIGVKQIASVTPLNPRLDPPPEPAVWVELLDGSTLVGSDYQAAKGEARIALFGPGDPLTISTKAIAHVRFKPQSDKIAAQWAEILKLKPASDIVVIRKEEAIDYLEGVVGDVSAEAAQFKLDGENVPVKRARLEGVIYVHGAVPELPEPKCVIADLAGSRIHARSVAFEQDALRVTNLTGAELKIPLARVSRLDFSLGNLAYLSDLKPEALEWESYFAFPPALAHLKELHKPRFDRALGQGPLKLDGKEYAKGLALHSRSKVSYRLRGAYKKFEAVVGIADEVRPSGNVRLVISGDERKLFEGTIAGSEKAKPLSLDVSGVKKLEILVDYGDDLDVADHLQLGEARVLK